MFIKGKCAIYIDKNLRVYEKSTVIFVLCFTLYTLQDLLGIFGGFLSIFKSHEIKSRDGEGKRCPPPNQTE